MHKWAKLHLERLAADERSAISKPYGSAIFKEDYRRSGVPVVRGVNLARGVFHDDDFVFIEDELANRMPGAEMRSGDLVVTHRGTVGQVSMIPRESRFERYVASTSHVKVRLDLSKALPEFYYYWFASPAGKRSILDNASTVGVPGIAQPVATVKRLLVPYPPIHEQQAIAEVLGALDDKIAANGKTISIANALTLVLADAAMSGASVALRDLCQVIMGSSPPGASYNETGEGLPFFQGVRDFGVRYPTQRVWTTAPVRLAEAKDTLISVRAPVGRTNLAPETLCLGRGLAGLRSRTGHPMVLFQQVRAADSVWAPYEASGTVFGSISKAQLESIEVSAVAPERADDLERELRTIEDRIAAALMESEALAITRDELLPLLMSGKVTVRDAKKTVSEVV